MSSIDMRCDEAQPATRRAAAAAAPAQDLVSAMRHHLRLRPDQVAVRYLADGDADAHELTYATLDARARALAAIMRTHGGADERVLLMLPTGLDYVVAFFACQYAGMIAVPAYPAEARHGAHRERLRGMAQDCAARIVILDDASRALLDGSNEGLGLDTAFAGAALLSPDAASGEAPADRGGFCIDTGNPQSLAFLQYTSGSTSAPKGVMVSHANLCANVDALAYAMDYRVDSRMFSWLPLYHDMGLIGSMLAPIVCGFPVTLISPLHFLERPARWLTGIARERATISGGPDFAFRLCADWVRDTQLAGLDLSSWRVAFCGSEPIRQTTLDDFAARFASHGLRSDAMFSCYGLAEATLIVSGVQAGSGAPETRFSETLLAQADPRAVRVTANLIDAATDDAQRDAKAVVGCGVTTPLHEFAVVDPAARVRVAEGRVGEIWCTGPSIAQGYWRNAEATAAVFLDDAPGFAGRWLRTGDLGFIDGGQLFVCGRRKDMIVVRGQNVYPQDVEVALGARVEWLRRGRISAFPVQTRDGAEAIGIAAEVPRGKTRQIAPDAIYAAIVDALGDALQHEAALVMLLEPGDLPRTSSGKLQRSACIPAWRSGELVPFAIFAAQGETADGTPVSGSHASANVNSAASLSASEAFIAQQWHQVLPIPVKSRDDNFFHLGGHSVLAMKAVSRLQQQSGKDVPLDLFFRHPTLGAFAAALDAHWADPSVQHAHGARDRALVARGATQAPLSLPQERLWVLWRLDPDSPAYNVSGALELDGEVDAAAVREAFDALVRRHEMLRTRFADIDDIPHQIVLPPEQAADAWRWEHVDVPGGERGTLAAQLRDRAREPFDLERGALLRATLFTLTPERHVLHFVMHHIVSDGWSIDVLLREFAAGYRAARRGEAPALPALPIQYADYAAWQRDPVDGAARHALDAQLGYWRERLAGIDALLDLPTEQDRSRPYAPLGARVGLRIPAALMARAEALARAEGATLFMVLLAALDALLYRYSGATDVPVAVPVAGRDRLETEGLIGFFVNTLVMRASVAGAQPFATLLQQVRADTIGAQSNRDVPFDRVIADLQVERRAAGNPLAQIKFMLHDSFDTALDLDGVQCRMVDADAGDVRFELALDITRDARGLGCVFTYATELYDDAFVAQFARHYVELIEQAVASPRRAIGEFDLNDSDDSDSYNDEDNDEAAHTLAVSGAGVI